MIFDACSTCGPTSHDQLGSLARQSAPGLGLGMSMPTHSPAKVRTRTSEANYQEQDFITVHWTNEKTGKLVSQKKKVHKFDQVDPMTREPVFKHPEAKPWKAKLAQQKIAAEKTSAPGVLANVGVSSACNGRPYMEDRHCIVEQMLPSRHGQSLFASVFDGHGGSWAAQYATDEFHSHFAAKLEADDSNSGSSYSSNGRRAATIARHFHETYTELDNRMLSLFSSAEKTPRDGTTALTMLMLGNELHVANAGDSRAVLGRSPAKVVLKNMYI